ncbi:lysophospholipid acyltransferase family protein [Streptomyces sp. NPDC058665]|uniref:lysophospholipid acyltransferase family protein n=1 Tax=Streptomyces sp. NPDC058665 TaxID=3346586 RepID=UPI00364B1233
MLSRTAAALVPFFGRLTVTVDAEGELAPGSIVAANHTSLSDPAIVLAALRQLGVEPVVMAAAGLWRVPLLGRALVRGGHVPVRRADPQAAGCLDDAAAALARGRLVLIYGEGGIPDGGDATELPPRPFRTGLARLAAATGAPVVPLGQSGARRVTSGGALRQFAGLATAPLRRPDLRVHIGAPVRLTGDPATATAQARRAVTDAWRTVAHPHGVPADQAAFPAFSMAAARSSRIGAHLSYE